MLCGSSVRFLASFFPVRTVPFSVAKGFSSFSARLAWAIAPDASFISYFMDRSVQMSDRQKQKSTFEYTIMMQLTAFNITIARFSRTMTSSFSSSFQRHS